MLRSLRAKVVRLAARQVPDTCACSPPHVGGPRWHGDTTPMPARCPRCGLPAGLEVVADVNFYGTAARLGGRRN